MQDNFSENLIELELKKAQEKDLEEILSLQKCAYMIEAEIVNDFSIQPLTQTIDELREEFKVSTIIKAVEGAKIIGSVRAFQKGDVCHIGKLIVHPDLQNKGIGKKLLKTIEKSYNGCCKYSLFTGKKSSKNLYFYMKAGYSVIDEKKINENLTFVYLEKRNSQYISGES